jgi:hypothetical protein
VANDRYEHTGNTFEYTNLEDVLDSYIEKKLPTAGYERLLRDYERYRSVYFQHNDDAVRKARFTDGLRELRSSRVIN